MYSNFVNFAKQKHKTCKKKMLSLFAVLDKNKIATLSKRIKAHKIKNIAWDRRNTRTSTTCSNQQWLNIRALLFTREKKHRFTVTIQCNQIVIRYTRTVLF